ncbi:disease resistance protein Pik-2-like [Triticum urartu]|uniref:disease resistance protein Pik-2-like n=1 Tax=Triticum urartu TaxID=4572 RepID=UPI002044141F|nr:disease resistance protein Pik-2-like [Triticum urartu]
MIQLQSVTTNVPSMSLTSCSVNGFFREYIVSQPMEDNMVFALEEHCSQNSQYTGRHLVIRSSWDRDRYVFDSIDFSRLRSLTVFGEWKSFFISEKMKVLRVLDLEDTSEVTNDDLEKIVKLLSRLKFLSLRGITSLSRLPDSLGNLKQLETLDVRHTSVAMLPSTIINLQKLQYIRAGTTAARGDEEPSAQERSTEGSSGLPNKFRRPRFISSHPGVKLPRGIGKLMALHTLGVIDVGTKGGHAILKELKNLTQVRKLGVSGVNHDNVQDFYSAIMAQGHLQSLSVRLDEDIQDFFSCLDDIPEESLKKNLTSFKLYGHVSKLPAWTSQLRNYIKLDLEMTVLMLEEVIDSLGDITFLRRLRLCVKPSQDVELNICFRNQLGREFLVLEFIEIDCSSRLQLAFEEGAMRYLHLLKVHCAGGSQISGLAHLEELKEVQIIGFCDVALKQDLERQLEEHPTKPKPVLMMEEVSSC